MADVELTVRVRYHEVDRMGIAYHPRYLTWFELARVALLRGAGLPYTELEARGIGLPVLTSATRHHRPLGFDEEFVVACQVAELGGARLRLSYRAHRDGELVAEGETEHAAIDLETRKPLRLPGELRTALGRLPSQGGDLPVYQARDPEDAILATPGAP
jgi:acyl-CoA thioester hydrolase